MERATRDQGDAGSDDATLPTNGEETEPSASAGPQEEPLPVRVGRYPVLRKLGQGGMGVGTNPAS